MDTARSTRDAVDGVSARDALQAAVVSVWGLDALCSYDCDSDRNPGIRRIEPED